MMRRKPAFQYPSSFPSRILEYWHKCQYATVAYQLEFSAGIQSMFIPHGCRGNHPAFFRTLDIYFGLTH